MEYRVLKYFLAVAREENITKASEALHLSQPALSRQLMQLEEELGTELFIRGKRKITLTPAGTLLRRRALEIIELTEKYRTHRKSRAGNPFPGRGTGRCNFHWQRRRGNLPSLFPAHGEFPGTASPGQV